MGRRARLAAIHGKKARAAGELDAVSSKA